METVQEFRGVDNLVYAKVITDTLEKFETGEVKMLAPVAEIAKTVETASDTKFYDNRAALTINAQGADTITTTIPALDLVTLADITGKQIDEETGAYLDGEIIPTSIALGYRLKLTDGTYRYVWRYKGTFGIPDETSATENAGTDTNNQQLLIRVSLQYISLQKVDHRKDWLLMKEMVKQTYQHSLKKSLLLIH